MLHSLARWWMLSSALMRNLMNKCLLRLEAYVPVFSWWEWVCHSGLVWIKPGERCAVILSFITSANLLLDAACQVECVVFLMLGSQKQCKASCVVFADSQQSTEAVCTVCEEKWVLPAGCGSSTHIPVPQLWLLGNMTHITVFFQLF